MADRVARPGAIPAGICPPASLSAQGVKPPPGPENRFPGVPVTLAALPQQL